MNEAPKKSRNTVWHSATVTRQRRERQNGHKSAVIWFTGLSGSGKSTLAHAVEERLHLNGLKTFVLDGDNMRHGLCRDLGFSNSDRKENIRRIGETAKLMLEAGIITITAFISPFKAERANAKKLMAAEDFIEIYCYCPLPVCEQRDTKGLYRKARLGEIADFTGISSPYEAPDEADLTLDTSQLTIDQCVQRIVTLLTERNILRLEQS